LNGYGGLGEICRGGEAIEAACMAHARRKIWDVHEKTKSAFNRNCVAAPRLHLINAATRQNGPTDAGVRRNSR
jgi:hypothetical protein